jgi:hypothetical protein
MPYQKKKKKMAALHYVPVYVSSDHPVEQMPYDTLHNGMAAIHCVSAYVSSDDSVE